MPFVYADYPYAEFLYASDFQASVGPFLMGAVADLVRHLRWTEVHYLYDSDAGACIASNRAGLYRQSSV